MKIKMSLFDPAEIKSYKERHEKEIRKRLGSSDELIEMWDFGKIYVEFDLGGKFDVALSNLHMPNIAREAVQRVIGDVLRKFGKLLLIATESDIVGVLKGVTNSSFTIITDGFKEMEKQIEIEARALGGSQTGKA